MYNEDFYKNADALKAELGNALERVKECQGIVHQITNNVTIHDCANVVLAIGASPIMADNPEEVKEIVAYSKALVLNIGTLGVDAKEAMLIAAKSANKRNIPIILDPVGVGASKLRRKLVTQLLKKYSINIVRCNVSELMAIYNENYVAGGVDSHIKVSTNIIEMAEKVAQQYNTVVAVTGVVDYVSDGLHSYSLHNGVDSLPRLTGTGCMTSALVGAFLTTNDSLIAAIAGISYMSIAGELAKLECGTNEGLGTFSICLHNALSTITSEVFTNKVKIEYL